MTLEKILSEIACPIAYVDQQLLKGYTHIADSLEKDGRDVDSLAAKLGYFGNLGLSFGAFATNSAYIALSFILINMPDNCYNSTKICPPTYIHFNARSDSLKTFTRFTRFSNFGLGALYITKSVYDATIGNLSTYSDHSPAAYASFGLALLTVASSQYLKDRDPKLRKRKWFFEEAYDKIKERVYAAQQKQPVPVPVRVRYEGITT